MKKRAFKRALMVLLACVALGFANQAGAILLDTSSPQYLGMISPDTPAGDADEASYINYLIAMALDTTVVDAVGANDMTRSGNAFSYLPTASVAGLAKDDSGDNTGSFGTGYTYLLAKYDGGNGGTWVWHVAGLTETFQIPVNFPTASHPEGYELSHYTLFNPGTRVPDGGVTAMLLALTMLGFGGLRRLIRG